MIRLLVISASGQEIAPEALNTCFNEIADISLEDRLTVKGVKFYSDYHPGHYNSTFMTIESHTETVVIVVFDQWKDRLEYIADTVAEDYGNEQYMTESYEDFGLIRLPYPDLDAWDRRFRLYYGSSH